MRVRNFLPWAILSLAFAGPAVAETERPAVWYRASEACPSGPQFLDKLAENSRQARLAEGGDHIDFVVTLLVNGRETVGRLERQTDSGIVAIRELRDATCEQVADALALSLGLALAPGQGTTEPALENAAGTSEPLSSAPSRTVAESASAGASSAPPPVSVSSNTPAPPAPGQPPPGTTWQWSVGLEFGPMIGISTHPLPRGELFFALRPAIADFLPDLSLHAGVVGATGSSETAVGPVRRWILAGRAEACPFAWHAGRLDLRPCVAFELGDTGASADGEGGLYDRSVWAAPGGQLRLAIQLQPKWLWLELSGGGLVPLTRNEIFSGSQSLYRDAPLIFHAGLGLSLRLP
jgi:hypothetical protein